MARGARGGLQHLRLILIWRLGGIESLNDQLLRAGRSRHKLEAGGAQIGEAGVLHGPLVIHNAERDYSNLRIGANVHIGREVLLDLTGPLAIGDGATVSMRTIVLTHADVGDRPLRHAYPRKVEETRIGAGAYIGANVTILAGCHIGDGAVVGAGAVVVQQVPDRTCVAGVPAKKIRRPR